MRWRLSQSSAPLGSRRQLGSLVEFSPDEVERHLQRAVEELRIMRSRGNVYFV